jgi:hypothetical protein
LLSLGLRIAAGNSGGSLTFGVIGCFMFDIEIVINEFIINKLLLFNKLGIFIGSEIVISFEEAGTYGGEYLLAEKAHKIKN